MATVPLSYKSILNLQRNNAFAVKSIGTADHDHLQLIIKDLGLYHGSNLPFLAFFRSSSSSSISFVPARIVIAIFFAGIIFELLE